MGKLITLPSGNTFNLTLNHVCSEFQSIKTIGDKSVVTIVNNKDVETLIYDNYVTAFEDMKFIKNSIKNLFINLT